VKTGKKPGTIAFRFRQVLLYHGAYAQVRFYVQSGKLVQDALFLACNWEMFVVRGFFVVFNLSAQASDAVGHDCSVPHAFEFIIHCHVTYVV
jgi:hypothetical protein